MKYRALWILEIALVLIFLFVLVVPVQDYAMREFKEYMRNPSTQTLKAFQDKREEEFQLRRYVAVGLGAAILVIGIPIYRLRQKNQKSPL